MSFLDNLSVTNSPWNVCRMSDGSQQWPRVSLRRRKGVKATVNSFLPTEGPNGPITDLRTTVRSLCSHVTRHENPIWANISKEQVQGWDQ